VGSRRGYSNVFLIPMWNFKKKSFGIQLIQKINSGAEAFQTMEEKFFMNCEGDVDRILDGIRNVEADNLL
jgi:hypothetical protein